MKSYKRRWYGIEHQPTRWVRRGGKCGMGATRSRLSALVRKA